MLPRKKLSTLVYNNRTVNAVIERYILRHSFPAATNRFKASRINNLLFGRHFINFISEINIFRVRTPPKNQF